jgi:Flp pilus assembly protein TadD
MRLTAPALALALLAGCGGGGATPGPEPQAEARAAEQVEAGNAAFARGDYEGAARRYTAATVSAPGDPAAWYGLGMALSRLGRDEEARAAYAKSRELSAARPAAPPATP